MADLLRPPKLFPGCRLAIYTPSYPAPALFPVRTARAVEALERLGFNVIVPPAARHMEGFKSGTPQARAAALMSLFRDSSIHGIVCAIGGYNSNEILPHLDYSQISQHPKVLVGYSDVTALLAGLHAMTGLVTFHGPALVPEWGEFPQPLDYTVQSFLALTTSSAIDWSYQPPTHWTNEFLDWAKGLDCRPRQLIPHSGWRAICQGEARGRLMGGNLETLNALVGSPYCPSFAGTLVFIEATAEEAYLPRLERALVHLELAGLFRDIQGLILARCPDAVPEQGVDVDSLVHRLGNTYDIPVAVDLDFGHTDPKLTLPVGVLAELTCRGTTVSLRLLEAAVT